MCVCSLPRFSSSHCGPSTTTEENKLSARAERSLYSILYSEICLLDFSIEKLPARSNRKHSRPSVQEKKWKPKQNQRRRRTKCLSPPLSHHLQQQQQLLALRVCRPHQIKLSTFSGRFFAQKNSIRSRDNPVSISKLGNFLGILIVSLPYKNSTT